MEKVKWNFYRRHANDCRGGHPKHSFSGEPEERRKGWKRCSCPIQVSGTYERKFVRKSTGATDWETAQQAVANWTPLVASPVPQIMPSGFDLDEGEATAIASVVKSYKSFHKDSAYSTRKSYGYLLERLQTFAAERGYTTLQQIRPADLRLFRESWGVSSTTENRYMGILKAFFEYAVQQEWVRDNVARKVKRPRNRNSQEDKERIPFSDAELDKMYYACEHLYAKDPRAQLYTGSGQDLADFISISVYTGLRISDVATFHIERLQQDGQLRIRTIKRGLAGKTVYTWVPEWLHDRIRVRAAKFGPYIFSTRPHENTDRVTDGWRKKLKRLWKYCGPWSAAPQPHRFRHTFARILLQTSGVTVRDVAELLGDTEEVVRKYYASWVSERQDRLTGILQDAFRGKPTPNNVVPMRLKG